jgi:hypothetical protein
LFADVRVKNVINWFSGMITERMEQFSGGGGQRSVSERKSFGGFRAFRYNLKGSVDLDGYFPM